MEDFTGYPEIAEYLQTTISGLIDERSASADGVSPSEIAGSPGVSRNDDRLFLRCESSAARRIELEEKNFSENPVQVTFYLRAEGSKTSKAMYSYQLPFAGAEDETLQSQLDRVAHRLMTDVIPLPPKWVEAELAVGESRYDKLGRRTAKQGNYEEALHYFLQAIDAYPADHAALYNTGVMHEALGASVKAKAFYQRAIKLKKDSLYVQALARK